MRSAREKKKKKKAQDHVSQEKKVNIVVQGFEGNYQAPTQRPPSLVLFDMRLGEGLSRPLAHRV